jgi:hypothetical protein
VVIGLTPGRSDEPASVETFADTRGQDGPVTARSEASIASIASVASVAKLEMLAEPALELVRETEEREHATIEAPSDMPASVASQPDFELVESSAAPAVHATALVTPDEMSIPPVGDLAVEPIADRFFSEGDLAAHDAPDEEWSEVAAKASRKSLPEVVHRRARFAKYVRWAVGGAAVVCLAAFARTAMTPAVTSKATTNALAAAAVAAAVEASPAAKAATPAVAHPAEPSAAAAAPPAPSEPAPPTAKAAEPAAEAQVDDRKVDVPKTEAPKADAPAVATSDKTAAQEKTDTRRALERGKLGDAIAAGERSVALDPTDGEAWLLLGAAYQEKGKNGDARRAYTSCVKEGKRGPIGECRAMIR